MKHIVENNIISIAANTENPNFPVSRCLDHHPKRKYKAGNYVESAVLTCDIVGGCSDIMLAGTNAATATVSIADPNIVEWVDAYWGGYGYGDLIPATSSSVNNGGGTDNIRSVFVYNVDNDHDFGVRALLLGFSQINFLMGKIPSPSPQGLVITSSDGTVLYSKNFTYDIASVYMLNCVAYAVMTTGQLWSYNFITLVETLDTTTTTTANDLALMVPVGRLESLVDHMPVPAKLLGTNDKAVLIDGPGGVGTTVTLCDVNGDDINNVAFDDSGNVWMTNETQASVDVFLVANTVADNTTPDYQFDTTTKPYVLNNPTSTKKGFCSCGDYIAYGSSDGLTLMSLTKFAIITEDCNTGWMGTGIKRAYFCEALGTTITAGATLPDYSGNGGALTVTGSLSISPMATGAEKQGVSGFSGTVYAREGYSADLDFATGDFRIEFVVIETPTALSQEIIASRGYYNLGAFSGSAWLVDFTAGGKIRMVITDDAYSTVDSCESAVFMDDSSVGVYCVQRKGGTLEIWHNGVRVTSVVITNATGSLSNANATLSIGVSQNDLAPLTNGKISNLRISSGSLTEAEILDRYQSEIGVYSANSLCTIQGASTEPKNCDFDYEKQQLVVATTDGVTVFRGLGVVGGMYSIGPTLPGSPRSISVSNGNMLYGTETLAYTYIAAYYPLGATEWASKELTITGTSTQQSRSNCLWIELSQPVYVPFIATLQVNAAKLTELEIGVITGNIAETYGGDPLYGFSVEAGDYSIKAENSNGSQYYKKRDIVRAFDVALEIPRENALKLLDNFMEIGETASAWRLSDLTGGDWMVYGKFNESPSVQHNNFAFSNVSFNILEVL